MPKNTLLLKDDAFIADLIDERDRALARNRSFEEIVEAQDQDLQAASTTIKSLCENAQETIHRLQAENARLKQLVTDTYNVHFGYEKNIGNEEWMSLSVSTLEDMKRIAEQEKGGRS